MAASVCEVEIENGNISSGGSIDVIGDKGFINGGVIVERSGLETSSIVLGSALSEDDQLKVENEKANVEKEEEEADINGGSQESLNGDTGRSFELNNVTDSEDMVVEVTDLDSGKIITSDCSLVPIESSQPTYTESHSSPLPLEDSISQDTISQLLPLLVEDTILQSSDIVGDDAKSEEETKDDPKFLTEDTELFETEVNLQEANEIIDDEAVEIIDDDAIGIIDDGKESQMVPADVGDDKHTEFKVDETPVLIFPNTLLSTDIQIQFGSFGLEKDVNSEHSKFVMEVSKGETESHEEIILDDLQKTKSADMITHEVVKDMDDVVPLFSVKGSSDSIASEVPRFDDDENLKDQIKNARLQLDEKERCRDAIGVEIKEKEAIVESHYDAFETASLELLAAKKLRISKKEELEFIKSLINKVKNAEDVGNKRHNVEHMIESRNQRYKIQDNLNNLQKEIESLKENVSKAEGDVLEKRKTYDDENKRGEELVAQFRASQKVCQQAYEHLCCLKTRLYHKEKKFYMYKEDETEASNFESGGDKGALHLPFANQVERSMEEIDTNDEFKEDDINVIIPSTTDETFHVSDISEKDATKSVSIPIEMESALVVPEVEKKKTFSPSDNEIIWKVVSKAEDKKTVSSPNHMMKNKEPVKFIVRDSKFVCLREIMEDEEKEETVVEVNRKEEELRKKETESNLKEQIQLEEKKKMDEAMKRKKRNAQKAQKRAEMRAQKDAELKEKGREKKLRKKERKRTGGSRTNDETPCGDSSRNSSGKTNDKKIVKNGKPNEAYNIEKSGVVTQNSVWWPWTTITALVRVLCSF